MTSRPVYRHAPPGEVPFSMRDYVAMVGLELGRAVVSEIAVPNIVVDLVCSG
jgi:hypothetical protein